MPFLLPFSLSAPPGKLRVVKVDTKGWYFLICDCESRSDAEKRARSIGGDAATIIIYDDKGQIVVANDARSGKDLPF